MLTARSGSPPTPGQPAQGPQNGSPPNPNSDDFAKVKVLFIYLLRSGEPMSLFLILATYLRENKSFFWPYRWQQKRVTSCVAPCRWRWVPRAPCGLGPLLMASFLLMNMLLIVLETRLFCE